MDFINRKKEYNTFKNDYQTQIIKNKTQVYIIEANHGIGKSEFIREVSKIFKCYPLDILQLGNNQEYPIFKRLVLELDKTSKENRYDDFRTFYTKKTNNEKSLRILLKITSFFGKLFTKNFNYDLSAVLTPGEPTQYKRFILNAQIENLFEYATYVFNKAPLHIVFHDASNIDMGSLDFLSKLITSTNGNVFIFETDNAKSSLAIEQIFKNNHNIFLKKYYLDKLSNDHIQTYIQQLSGELNLQVNITDSYCLKESIEKGDLEEISGILKDFNARLQNDTSAKIRNMKEIIQSLSDRQKILLITIFYSNGKLEISEIKDIINDLTTSFYLSDIDTLSEKNLIEKFENCLQISNLASPIINMEDFDSRLKFAVASCLIKNLNTKLKENYNNRYVDVLVEYYLNNKQYEQLETLLPHITERLKNFSSQAERIDYFRKFDKNRHMLYRKNNKLAIKFAKIAYNANLYFEAKNFINLLTFLNDEMVFLKALVLNRCEEFEKSKKFINDTLKELDNTSSLYFKLSLILMMDLIQLNERNEAKILFNTLATFIEEPLYPYLIRLSNVFSKNFKERLTIVESITENIYTMKNDEFSGLHAIYLAYLYAINEEPQIAEKSLLEARTFLGDNLIYNHMILHNEATIRFHSGQIDDEIPLLLNNAKITAYDEYDRFAINNNLLVYYILSDKTPSLECQKIVFELEEMLKKTNFKRFVDKINYNLYYYYKIMFNIERSNYYQHKLKQLNIDFNDKYNYKLIYETSWKLPIDT